MTSLAGFHFPRDGFSITVDGRTFESERLPPPRMQQDGHTIRYKYPGDDVRIEVVYELNPGWKFASKQLKIGLPMGKRVRVNRVSVFRGSLTEPVRELYPCSLRSAELQTRDCGGFLRFDNARGLLAVVQNPFLAVDREGNAFTVSYEPDVEWDAAWGPFESDRGLLAPYTLTGRKQPAKMLPEWKWAPLDAAPGMDAAEVETFTECVRAFVTDHKPRPVNVFVGWCVNDYQIDISTPEGRAEYKRIIDRAAEMGAQHVLFAPANTAISLRARERATIGAGRTCCGSAWARRSGGVSGRPRPILCRPRSPRCSTTPSPKTSGCWLMSTRCSGFWPAAIRTGSHAETTKAQPRSLGVRSTQDWLTRRWWRSRNAPGSPVTRSITRS